MKIHNTPQQQQAQPASEAREQRLDQVQEALDEQSVKVANLSDEDRAANRSYGAQMLSDIDGVQSAAPEGGESRTQQSQNSMMDFFGYGPSGIPGMDQFSAMMMMLMVQQHMMMILMMMALMQGAQMPPNWQDGWDSGFEPDIDEIQDGGGPKPNPDDHDHPHTDDVDGPATDETDGPTDGTDNNQKQMTPVRATRILSQYFDLLDTAAGIGRKDGIIGRADLEAVSSNPDAPKDLKDAVAYLLRNPMVLNAIDVGAGKGRVDGRIGKNDLDKFIKDHAGKEGYDIVADNDKPWKPDPMPSERTEAETTKPEKETATEETSTTEETRPTPESNAAELRAQQDASRIHEAVDGAGTDEAALTRILGGRTNEDIQAIKSAYSKAYGKKLEQVIKSETSGHLETLLLALLEGRASESAPVDKAQVSADVGALHNAISGWGTDEATLIRILASRSKKHLAEVSTAYEKAHGEKLSEAIKGDTSGALESGLLQNL